jgi:hypothetical protein
MSTFPTLKSGAIAQYPATSHVRFGPTQVVEFLDGSSDRYCTGPGALRQWHVRLAWLDARECATVIDFLRRHQDTEFSFVEPFSGETVPRCGFQGFEFRAVMAGEMNEQVAAVIEELR